MADTTTTEAKTDQAEKAKPAPGRANDPELQRLAENINRLMGPGGDTIDVRVPRALLAA